MSGLYNGSVVVENITVPTTPADGNEIELGFVPGKIEFMVLSGTNEGLSAEWNENMADASALVHATEAAAAAILTTKGVTPISNTAGKVDGFSLGALVGIADTAADVIIMTAYRSAK